MWTSCYFKMNPYTWRTVRSCRYRRGGKKHLLTDQNQCSLDIIHKTDLRLIIFFDWHLLYSMHRHMTEEARYSHGKINGWWRFKSWLGAGRIQPGSSQVTGSTDANNALDPATCQHAVRWPDSNLTTCAFLSVWAIYLQVLSSVRIKNSFDGRRYFKNQPISEDG